jgi:hypothetical protein
MFPDPTLDDGLRLDPTPATIPFLDRETLEREAKG